MRIVRNTRPRLDWNTCAQAAVATLLARHGIAPFDWRIFSDSDAIDRVCTGFPPDVPFGLGTSAWRIAAAVRGYGISAEHVHSGWFGRNRAVAFERLRRHLRSGGAAIVCLDMGRLGGSMWSAHWAVALGISDQAIEFGNLTTPEGTRTEAGTRLSIDRFLRAWRCRHLPWGHQDCAILVGTSSGQAPRSRPSVWP